MLHTRHRLAPRLRYAFAAAWRDAPLGRHPQGFGRALAALEFHLSATREIVVIGPNGNKLERAVLSRYLPEAVIVLSENGMAGLPLLEEKGTIDGNAAAYVCENFVCKRPVTTLTNLEAALS